MAKKISMNWLQFIEQRRDAIAAADAAGFQRVRQSAGALIELGVALPSSAVHERSLGGGALGIDGELRSDQGIAPPRRRLRRRRDR
jgi:hypothetical protein